MINYNSPIETNDALIEELNNKLSNEFEENIVNVFGKYITDELLDDKTYSDIARVYEKAKDAYLEALAAIIMYPDALDYID